MNIKINNASESDIDDLLIMNEKLHEIHTNNAPDVFKPFDRNQVYNWFCLGVKNEKCKIIVAKINNLPIGYAYAAIQNKKENVFCLARKIIEIDHMYVSEKYRNNGVSRELLTAITLFARQNKISDIELSTWCFNETAQIAFEKMGFVNRFVRYQMKI